MFNKIKLLNKRITMKYTKMHEFNSKKNIKYAYHLRPLLAIKVYIHNYQRINIIAPNSTLRIDFNHEHTRIQFK